ncbi:MAG: hypothetical protein HYY84_13370 [Deltaproteobacteria bacterium]|nr:hypothetical protein [Deltaproteobacteria bacterium]
MFSAPIVEVACDKAAESGRIDLELSLPLGMWTDLRGRLGRVEVWLDEAGLVSPFADTTAEVVGVINGVSVRAQIEDIDGDGKNEIRIAFQSSPFVDDVKAILPITANRSYAAGTFLFRAALYEKDTGVLLMTAKATFDENGYAIQFLGQRLVRLIFVCEPLLNCPETSAGVGDAGPSLSYVELTLALPVAPDTTISPSVQAKLGPIELSIDGVDGGKISGVMPWGSDGETSGTHTPDAVSFRRVVTNIDGDPENEVFYKVDGNPFATSNQWRFDLPGTVVAAPLTIRASLYSNDGGVLVSSASVSTDTLGRPIQFGTADAAVNITFTCASTEVCTGADGGVSDAGQ